MHKDTHTHLTHTHKETRSHLTHTHTRTHTTCLTVFDLSSTAAPTGHLFIIHTDTAALQRVDCSHSPVFLTCTHTDFLNPHSMRYVCVHTCISHRNDSHTQTFMLDKTWTCSFFPVHIMHAHTDTPPSLTEVIYECTAQVCMIYPAKAALCTWGTWLTATLTAWRLVSYWGKEERVRMSVRVCLVMKICFGTYGCSIIVFYCVFKCARK